jgi:hypothetical protein
VTVLDDLPCAVALGRSGDVEDASFDATGTEATPVGVRQTQDERFFGGVLRLERVGKAAENCFILVLLFLGEDDESGGTETVLDAVGAATVLAGFGLGSALAAILTIGLALSI